MKNKVFIIAEAGVNHNGSIKKAIRLVDIAANAGADAVKFQITNAELITKRAKKADYQKVNSKRNETQYEMIKKLELNWKVVHPILINRCHKKKVIFMTSAFDIKGLNEIRKLGINFYKVPSGEINNIPYLKHLGSFNKKTFLSTGMSTISEIDLAVKTLLNSGLSKKKLIILHCNSAYPTPYRDVNLNVIKILASRYKVPIGFSDHTLGIEAPVAAVALGAKVIEKHFTISKQLKGPDHTSSLEPQELNAMVKSIRNIENALGKDKKIVTKSERINKRHVRKSIVALKEIDKGEIFSEKNITLKRPGTGLQPIHWYKIIGKKSKRNYKTDDFIND